MAPATAERRPPRPKRPSRPPKPPRPWWGEGAAPHELWPGVSITIPAVWSAVHRRWETDDGLYYFDADEADRACEFFPEYLSHHIGDFAGERFELLEYQQKLLTRPLFGWKRAADGLRRFRKVFAFIPKGSGKSPWASGTGLYLLFCDHEAAAEIYALAADRQQARTVHDNAKIMVEDSPELDAMAEVVKNTIYVPETRSSYMVLSSDASSAHGKRPHAVIFDEFHAQRDRDLYEALKKSLAKRAQPVILLVTHAGDDDEGICFEEYEYAKGVLAGHITDPACLPVVFEAAPGDDWTSPAVWRKVNPGHGITIRHDGIAGECLEAQNDPRKLNDFLRFHLNRWVNQATAWIPVDWWDAGAAHPFPSDAVLAAAPVAVGIDMAQKIDLSAAVAVFRLPLAEGQTPDDVELVNVDELGNVVKRTLSMNYRIAVIPRFWIPEDTAMERSKADHVPYYQWALEETPYSGRLIDLTEGAVVDSEKLVRYVTGELSRRFPLVKQAQIGYDPAFATDVSIRLTNDGYLPVEVRQNYTLSEAAQMFEALVKAKRVIHGGHRVLRWNVENAAVKRDDAGRIRIVKPRRASKRIDGLVATVIALSRLMMQPPPTPVAPPRISVIEW